MVAMCPVCARRRCPSLETPSGQCPEARLRELTTELMSYIPYAMTEPREMALVIARLMLRVETLERVGATSGAFAGTIEAPQRGQSWVSQYGEIATVLGVIPGFSVTYEFDGARGPGTAPLTDFLVRFRPVPIIEPAATLPR